MTLYLINLDGRIVIYVNKYMWGNTVFDSDLFNLKVDKCKYEN